MANIRKRLQHIKQSILNPSAAFRRVSFVTEAGPGSLSITQMHADGRNKFKTVNTFRLAAVFGPIYRTDVPRLTSVWLKTLQITCMCTSSDRRDVSLSFYHLCWPRWEDFVLSALFLILKMNRYISHALWAQTLCGSFISSPRFSQACGICEPLFQRWKTHRNAFEIVVQ